MRLLTFNIRLGLDSSLERIAEVIRALGADAACLQEVGRHWTMGEAVDMQAVIAERADLAHSAFAPAIQQGAAQYGIALLSRHPFEVLERVPLPRKDDEPRVLLAARLRAPEGPVLLATTHLSVVAADRPDQFHSLTRWVLTLRGRERLPTIVAGDLNAPLGEPACRTALGWLKLRSAAQMALGEVPATFPAASPSHSIDHILVSRDIAVSGAGVDGLGASDHLALWADLAVGG